MLSQIHRMVVVACLLAAGPFAGLAGADAPAAIPEDDYGRYDQIVVSKFLTSETTLVLMERQTTTQISPKQEGPLTQRWFQEEGYFDGTLSWELIKDFIAVNREPVRLEGRFQFGVRYRFISGTAEEAPEVSRAIPVRRLEIGPVVDRLVWSRIGYTRRHDQALVYVGHLRPDGSGAGFLVWFRRQGTQWTIWDTEVIWTVQLVPESDGGPLLAP